MGSEAAWIVTAGTIDWILSWIFAALLIYNGYKFYRLRNEFVFIKRRGNIVIAYNLCAIIILLFGYPLLLLVNWDWNLFTNHNKSSIYILLIIASDLFYNPFYYFVTLLTLLRCWMIYYDIYFSNSCLNLKWKQIITLNIDTLKKEKWYIQHRKTFGNESFMLKITFLCGTIISIISLTSVYLYKFGVTTLQIWHFLNAILFIPFISTLIIIIRKMPTFNDNIYLYKEFKVISYCWCLSFVCYSIAFSIAFIIGVNFMTRFVAQISGMSAIFIIPFVSTYWVLKQIQLFSNQNNNNDQHIHHTLDEILRNNELINFFMQHLIKEFSIECLLAVIEFQQYKAYLLKKLDITHIAIDFVFPQHVPLSDIVYMDNNDNSLILEFKIKAYKLYNKYIKIGSEFEINISYQNRCTLDYLLYNKDEWIAHQNINEMDLVKIFDAATKEMIQLLNHSKGRFKYQTI